MTCQLSDNTLNKALRIMGYDTGPGGDHLPRHGLPLDPRRPLLKRGRARSIGDVVEAQLAHDTEEKKKGRRRRNEVVRRQLGKGDKKQDSRHL